jgi:hypothetical protein
MHARIDGGQAKLLTRTGLDWSHRYKRTIGALQSLKVKSAYIDGELCALNADGVPVFSRLQAAMDEGKTDQLVFFAFDLLFLNGESTAQLPLIKCKERLQSLFKKEIGGLRYSEQVAGNGPQFRAQACKLGLVIDIVDAEPSKRPGQTLADHDSPRSSSDARQMATIRPKRSRSCSWQTIDRPAVSACSLVAASRTDRLTSAHHILL